MTTRRRLAGKRLPLTLAFGVLVAAAIGAGCHGFFVNPTLSSLAVGPASPTIETGNTDNTVQMTAFGTYSDGSTGYPSVAWTSSEPSIATVSASGLVTSVSTGTTSITATANQNPSITGSQTITVTVGCIESITLNTTSLGLTNNTPTGTIIANAVTCNGTINISDTATWTSSNTAVATVSAGTVTAEGNGTATVTASVGNITSTNSCLVTVSGFTASTAAVEQETGR